MPEPTSEAATAPLDALLAGGARVAWVAAHPDDEFLAGPILVRAARFHRVPVRFVILTRGEGGAGPDGETGEALAARRVEEMRAVAARYGAELQQERFWNAPLPASSFPPRHEIWARWRAQGDPVAAVAEGLRAFRPDVLLTFDPDRGATDHPEHQLASRVATAAVRSAADEGAALSGAPHRVGHVYYVLKRHWLFRLAGGADPGPADEVFDGTLPGDEGLTCAGLAAELTRLHATQAKDMGLFRRARRLFARPALRRVDPWTQIAPVDAPP